MYVRSNCFHCPTISPLSQLALKHDGACVVQCLLEYGTEKIRGMVYEELKGEHVRRNDCEDREKQGTGVRKIEGRQEGKGGRDERW